MHRAADVLVTRGGTVYLFHLRTASAREWVEENVSPDRLMLGAALAVEHRFAENLAQGMAGDGLLVRIAQGVL